MMDAIKMFNSSPSQKGSTNLQDPITVVLANMISPPVDGENRKKLVACGLSRMISDHQNSKNPHQDITQRRN